MHTPALDPPRMPDGFRHRGTNVTRLEAFVDAAFAFSVTLLVIAVGDVPDSIDALIRALKNVPAFGASFAMIALFWAAHARWSRRFGLDDTVSTLLSLALVFLVLVYVYPLKLMFATAFAWITQGWIPWPTRLRGFDDVKTMFVIYGSAFALMSLSVAALHMHALRRRAALMLDADERAITVGEVFAWSLGAAVGLLSLVIAATIPSRPALWQAVLPGGVYFLMNLTWVLAPRVAARARRRAAAV